MQHGKPAVGSHSVIDLVEKARALRGRQMWAVAFKFPHADIVKLIVRENDAADVVLYAECSSADAMRLLELAGFNLENAELDELAHTFQADGMSVSDAIDTALLLRR
jgi:hypothetical protein